MRIGILSYPMLFQRKGGLQIQINETITALQQLASPTSRLTVDLVDPCRNSLNDYDVIHVFSAFNGNHRIIETALDLGVATVLSPLISPGWGRASGVRARIAAGLTLHITGGAVQTSFTQIETALHGADVIVALGAPEQAAIMSAFRIAENKIRVISNGINSSFFGMDSAPFRAYFDARGEFALMVGAISPYKNQLGVAQVLAAMKIPFVVIGRAEKRDLGYLEQLKATSGVRYLGALDHDDPLLASAYAAASIFVLPSKGEVFPLTALEALASGTPVMLTDQSALDLNDSEFALRKVRWDDPTGQRQAIADLLAAKPSRPQVQALVRHLTWQNVGQELLSIYANLTRAR